MIHKALLIIFTLLTVCSRLVAQGSVLLVGGGSEDYNDWSDEPYRWLVDHAPNKKILVMHYSTGSTWLEGYFKSFGAVSATSLVVSTTAAANDSAIYKTILAADGIFLRGGDQWQYVSIWKGTLAAKAIKEVFQRGGVVGGTSAGEMVLSEVVFDAQYASTDPRTALRNPSGASITFTENLFGLVPGILADSHFYERGRLGRLLAMIALYKQQKGREIAGVGVDYNTALAIGPDGFGEVMGAGTVTVLRFALNSTYAVEAGKPLAMTNIQLNQLTDGFKVSITSWQIQAPPTSTPWKPRSILAAPARLFVDGSGTSSDWYTPTGSVKRFIVQLLSPSTDTVGVISSPASPANGANVASFLAQNNTPSRQLLIHEGNKNDAGAAYAIRSCKGFILVSNNVDSLGRLFSATATGTAFQAAVKEGKPLLFLSSDGSLASDSAVGQLQTNIYGAYYGYLTLVQGAGVLSGVNVVTRIFEDADLIDNRLSGLFWGMGKTHMPIGLLIDNGAHLSLTGTTLQAYGSTPVMVIDARQATLVDFPAWKDPGKANPRQNAAFIGAMIHVVRDQGQFDFGYTNPVRDRTQLAATPEKFGLEQNYPNPFNPTTTMTYELPTTNRISLRVFDLLGREVAVLVDEKKAPGVFAARWDASGLAGGIYFARLSDGTHACVQKLLLLK